MCTLIAGGLAPAMRLIADSRICCIRDVLASASGRRCRRAGTTYELKLIVEDGVPCVPTVAGLLEFGFLQVAGEIAKKIDYSKKYETKIVIGNYCTLKF